MSPMIVTAKGPTTAIRRLVRDPANAAPPQPLDQPIPTSTAATTGIEKAGRYTIDDSAKRGRRVGVLARTARGLTDGAGGMRTVVTTMTPGRTLALERDSPRS